MKGYLHGNRSQIIHTYIYIYIYIYIYKGFDNPTNSTNPTFHCLLRTVAYWDQLHVLITESWIVIKLLQWGNFSVEIVVRPSYVIDHLPCLNVAPTRRVAKNTEWIGRIECQNRCIIIIINKIIDTVNMTFWIYLSAYWIRGRRMKKQSLKWVLKIWTWKIVAFHLVYSTELAPWNIFFSLPSN